MQTRRLLFVFTVAIIGSRPSPARSEDLDAPDPDEVTTGVSKAYQYDHEYFSIRFGGGLLNDYNHVEQDEDSEQQLPGLHSEIGIRDLRVLVSGRTPWKPVTYTTGYMYDANKNEWVFRQTGLKLTIDALHGFFFVGRTKEGFSTNKLMVGYYGWFNERSAANDAFLPILADGIR
jgi:phosphate-selective porin OprO/OprP